MHLTDLRHADNQHLIDEGLARVYKGRLIPILKGGEGEDTPPPERPGWLPDKFDSPEALAKSYGELESKLGTLAERAKQADALEENYNALTAQVEQLQAQQQQGPRPDANAQIEQLNEMYATDPVGTMAYLAQTAAQQAVQQQNQAWQQQQQVVDNRHVEFIASVVVPGVIAKHDDWDEYKERIAELTNDETVVPAQTWFNPVQTEAALERVYAQAKGEALIQGKIQPQTAADVTAMKIAAQTATGAGGRPVAPEADKAAWDAIKSAGPKSYYDGLPQ